MTSVRQSSRLQYPWPVFLVLLLAAHLFRPLPLPSADTPPVSLTGKWVGRMEPTGLGMPVAQPLPASLTLVQSGSTITGTFSEEDSAPIHIVAGQVDRDGRITFGFRNAQNFLVTAILRKNGDWIRGRMTTSTATVRNIALKKQ